MPLNDLLLKHKTEILREWFGRIADGYPAETASFLKKQQNRFSNPVGHAFTEGTAALLQALLENRDLKSAKQPLELMVKIRAVQEVSPSEAVGFIYLLKEVLQQELGEAIRQQGLWDELIEIGTRIDRLALTAFDMFMASREKIYGIRARAVERRYSKLDRLAR
jgi:hypothetical protein